MAKSRAPHNPSGNPNPGPGKRFERGRPMNPTGKNGTGGADWHKWRSMLTLVLQEKTEDGHTKLRHVADACVNAAMGGDMAAIKEIGDRMDGKPKQTLDIEATTMTHEERLGLLAQLAVAEVAEAEDAGGTTRH